MSGKERLDGRTVRKIEKFLKARQVQLKEAVRSVVSERRATEAGRTADVTVQATATLDDEIQVALADRHSRQLAQIEAALERLARGQYGICHDCEEFIGLARIEALPFAHRCSACQARAERKARQTVSAAPEAA
jgi:RNA polymerase-binding transcription factor